MATSQDRFEHTIENCFLAKSKLIEKGFTEEDFYIADEDYTEVGYLVGEPMLITNDDFCKSALELYKESLCSQEDDDNMVDFYIEKGLL
jgi:hypothetical protein